MTDAAPQATASAETTGVSPRPINLSALLGEGLSKSSMLWVEVPGDRAWAVWHARLGDEVLIVSGPGEQHLPWLPEQVNLILRSKDSGGRLLTVAARAQVVEPTDPRWSEAADALKAERLNATGDVMARWAAEGTIHALRPFGAPLEAPGAMSTGSGRSPVPGSDATTAKWRPWHWRGRPQRRRRQR